MTKNFLNTIVKNKITSHKCLHPYSAAVIVVSDRCSQKPELDTSGENLVELLKNAGFNKTEKFIVPDEIENIKNILKQESTKNALILTTGGTGFAPRDITPEATTSIIERPVSGIPEAMRSASMQITDKACLSRGTAGIRGKCLIINLPGSLRAAEENFLSVLNPVIHGIEMLNTADADCAGHYK